VIIIGNSIDVIAAMKPNSVDAIVTDPPYGLEFMGRAWDAPWKPSGFDGRTRDNSGQVKDAYARTLDRAPAKYRAGGAFQEWTAEWAAAALHALKPGGHLIAFGGTRTHHRAWSGIEDAGFEIRDTLMWLYGSGFPKSSDISKAIDSGLGAVRDALPLPVTDEAKALDGWGTALKPGWEPICLARKLPKGAVWRNVLEHGTGGLNIDATRIAGPAWLPHKAEAMLGSVKFTEGEHKIIDEEPHEGGRWPANVILTHSPECEHLGEKRVRSHSPAVADPVPEGEGGKTYRFKYGKGRRQNREQWRMEAGTGGYADADGLETVEAWACEPGCPVRILDEQSGVSSSTGGRAAQVGLQGFRGGVKAVIDCQPGYYGDEGGASRFFYTAKASSAERNAWGRLKGLRNGHPTVKPLDLMAWLVRLVTPPGGLVLDPFAGSGTTLVAARREGFRALGIEMDPESARIARARLDAQWEVKLL
jgi:site-specific DNA-methyltransferase (adenine-specific)